MDSITHFVLGGVIGQAYAGNKVGRKALVLGAIAQSIPDIDFIAAFWLSPVDNLLVHRGFTHSILFGVLISILLGWVVSRWSDTTLSRKQWTLLFALEIFVHLFLDGLNNYGVGWLEPFSHQRIAFNILFVADPFFSIWVGIGCVALLIIRGDHPSKKYWTRFTLVLCSLYFVYALINKVIVYQQITRSLQAQSVHYHRLLTTPAPFNNWLWYYAAETDSGFHVGYRSVFGSGNKLPRFFPRQSFLLKALEPKDDLEKLIRFSNGFYTVESHHDTLVFNDLRFGQVAGWSDPNARFAFHYYVNYPEANALVVQRGRFENWNRKTIRSFFRRIAGDED